MTRSEAGRLGSIKSIPIQRKNIAKRLRQKRKEYYENPKKCLHCDSVIKLLKGKFPRKVKNRKFCNSSCAAIFNNTGKIKTVKLENCVQCQSKLKTGKRFCNQTCKARFNFEYKISQWKLGSKIPNKVIRQYLLVKYQNKCVQCGWNQINLTSGKVPLEMEHIDGNSENNVEENLTLLCPNCHSLTSTYKGLNRGKGRFKRRQRYKEGKSF